MTPSPNTVHLNAGGGGVRVKSYTPLIVPGHKSQYHNNDQRMRTTSGSSSSSVEKSSQEFYAGAKFDFSPSVASLPTPPTTWTIPLIRSQSQPSSPVTTSMTNQQQQNGTSIITTKKIDVNSLFLTPQSNKIVKASSFEMVKGSSTVNNEKMFEKEQRLGTQRKMNKKTVDKFSQSRNRNWNEKDTLKSNQKSATVTTTNTSTTTIVSNNNTKNTSNTTTTIPTNKMNTPMNHHQQKQQQTYHHSSSSSSSPRSVIQVVETKQKQMMYPQLTEHLRGLLKVQG